jgi:hypothetical protein
MRTGSHGQRFSDRGFFWRWSSHSKLTLDRATVAACSIQIDDLPLEHRAGEKPTVRKTLTVMATRFNNFAVVDWHDCGLSPES